jgi:predicted DNA-binding ribbon-helix-helix protein
MTVSRLVNRTIKAEQCRTSIRLEPELWESLTEIGQRENQDIGTIVRQIESTGYTGGRTSAVRIYIFNYFRAAVTENGHARAGHGPLREDYR